MFVHRYHPVIWDFAVVLSSLGAVKNKADGGDTQELQLVKRFESDARE